VVYDGDENRVSKTVGGVTTKYLVDTNNLTGYAQVVEELQNNQVVKQYTYGLDLISQRQSSGLSFYNYDGHGSVRGLSDNLGSLTDTYTYDAFGTIIERTGTTDNNYLYAGEQFDSDLGFYYNRARYLNVGTGRFISQDSYEGNSSEPLSLHKYTYVHNNPINGVDPSGYFFDTGISFGVRTTLANIAYPLYARVLAAVATSVLIIGGIASPFAELNAGLAQARANLKTRVEQDSKREGSEILFHYTSKQSALEIFTSGGIFASLAKRFEGFTFPAGAYATDIAPWSIQFTQRRLSALFYGGNENKDVSFFVAIKKNDFIPIVSSTFPNQYYRPAISGDFVPIEAIVFGPNLMLR
jgi:RHS repeat-associated protein